MKKRLASALCVTALLSGSAYADYIEIGIGMKSCGSFIEATDQKRHQGDGGMWNLYASWTGGLLTAYNSMNTEIDDITAKTDMDGIMAAIEKVCREHPLETYAKANFNVAVELLSDYLNLSSADPDRN